MAGEADDETAIMLNCGLESFQRMIKSLFFKHIHGVTLVFSKAEAWPRRCSIGITRIIAKEELCLCDG